MIKISRRHSGITLIELMVVIGIASVLLAMGGYHYRKSHNTQVFNNEVELFYGGLNSVHVLSQACGLLSIKNMTNFSSLTHNIDNLSDLSSKKGAYYWIIKQNGEIKGMGKIGSMENTVIKLNSTYKDFYNKTISQGAWMELYSTSRDNLKKYNSSELISKKIDSTPVAKIVFQADGSPIVPGKIEISTLSGKSNKATRIRIIEIDKNGGMKLSVGKI